MAKTIAEKIISTRDKLKAQRETWKSLCDDTARYFAPEMEDLLLTSDGAELLQPVVSSGILAQERLVSGLFSNTMSMGRGQIVDEDSEKMRSSAVARFYKALSNVTHRRIQSSPFPEKYEELLQGFCCRGSGVMYVHWDRGKSVHKYQVYPATCCFEVRNVDGEPVEMYREFKLDAAQAVGEYGEDGVSEEIRKAFEKGDYDKKFEFIHCLRPRRMRSAKRADALNMPFESIHVEVASRKKVRVGGSQRFRYLVPRFSVKDGESNGRSPAFRALPVMRTLMKCVSDHIDGVEMAIGPPIFLPDKDAVSSAIMEAFAVNYADMSKGEPFLYAPGGDLRLSADFIEFMREELSKLHYVDLFAMLEQLKSGQKTAYEISQLVAERIQAIAPVINRLSRFFASLYDIVAEDLAAAGLVGVEMPPELLADDGGGDGSGYNVTYTSRLDVQLAELELTALQQAVVQAAEMVQAIKGVPELDAALKVQEIIFKVFRIKNVDVEMLYTELEYEKHMKEFAEQAAQAAAQEQMGGMVKPVDLQKVGEPGSAAESMGELMAENGSVAI